MSATTTIMTTTTTAAPTTMTMTTLDAPLPPLPPPITSVSVPPAPNCPGCGAELDLSDFAATHAALLAAQRHIADLQAQVRLLNQKAAAAVDRWADYEDELVRLRAAVAASQSRPPSQIASPPPATSPPPASYTTPRSSFLGSGAAHRISALLSPRKSSVASPPPPALASAPASRPSTAARNSNSLSGALASPPPGGGPYSPARPLTMAPSADDLLEALTHEQALRFAAEGKLNDTSREVEELSVQLFEQANEMVATERRARAKLEARIELLEKRDVDKRQRLDRLESAMERIARAKRMLGQPETDATEAPGVRVVPTPENLG